MNDRLTIQDFTDLLAAKHSMNKKDAEAFVKEFFFLIEQALEDEKYVKIKGLGTFKLIDVDSRESVNVNTGERFQIQEHSKVSFTPDANLRDTINKPFSHFETVVLNEKTVLPDTPIEEMGEEGLSDFTNDDSNLSSNAEESDNIVDNVPHFEGQKMNAEQNEDNITHYTHSQKNEVVENDFDMKHEDFSDNNEIANQKNEIIKESQPINTNAALNDCKTPVEPDHVLEKRSAEEIIALELQRQKEISSKTEILKEASFKEKMNRSNSDAKDSRTHVSFLIAIIFIVILICGGTLVYIYNPDLFSKPSNTDSIQMPLNEKKESIIPALPDSTKVNPSLNDAQKIANSNTEATDLNVNKELVENKSTLGDKRIENVKDQKNNHLDEANLSKYVAVGTKTTHKIKSGETLTKVSLMYYGSKAFWPFIVKYNRDVIKDPDNVPFGTAIKIPELVIKK